VPSPGTRHVMSYLHRVLVGEEVDDLQGVLDDAGRHELLTAVAALAHQGAGEALDDGALRRPAKKSPGGQMSTDGSESETRAPEKRTKRQTGMRHRMEQE